MKVSIIIPIYNVEQYIEKCVRSVMAQDWDGAIECILVDDCTPDGSMALVEKMLSTYTGSIDFHIVHHECNGGLSAARNTGLRVATGDYIYFLDSDDYIEPFCISSMMEMVKKYPGVDIVQAGTNSTWGDFSLEDKPYMLDYTCDRIWIKKTFMKRPLCIVPSWNKLIRKELVKKNNLFFKEEIIHEDEHWNFFACKYISSIAFCKRNTYNYVTRDGSIMTGINVNVHTWSWLNIMDDLISNIDDESRVEQIGYIFKRLHNLYLFYSDRDLKPEVVKRIKKLSSECSLIGKITIALLLVLPDFLNKKKTVYTYFFEDTLLPYF